MVKQKRDGQNKRKKPEFCDIKHEDARFKSIKSKLVPKRYLSLSIIFSCLFLRYFVEPISKRNHIKMRKMEHLEENVELRRALDPEKREKSQNLEAVYYSP